MCISIVKQRVETCPNISKQYVENLERNFFERLDEHAKFQQKKLGPKHAP